MSLMWKLSLPWKMSLLNVTAVEIELAVDIEPAVFIEPAVEIEHFEKLGIAQRPRTNATPSCTAAFGNMNKASLTAAIQDATGTV